MKKKKRKITGIVVATLLLGSMLTVNASTNGWVKTGNNWSYVKEDGAKATGWLQEGNRWYYLDEKGIMRTGWQQVNGKWYYLTSNGTMKTGWLQEGNNWYYLDGSGAMKTGWQQIGGKWYYLNSNGVMVSNTTIDGYYIGADGSWEENEQDLFYSYLKNEIIPIVGLSSLEHFDSMENYTYASGKKFSVDSKHIGLISTYIGDINYDGIEEMIVFYTKQETDEEFNIADEITLYFDLYTIKNNKVHFLKKLGSVNTRWYLITDYRQELKIGIKEYKNHTYMFINDNAFLENSFSYYDLTDLNNILKVSYRKWYKGTDGSDYTYEKITNNKTERLLNVKTSDYINLDITGKYSSEEEAENAIRKELDVVGLGKDIELNSQKILEWSVSMFDADGCEMGINIIDYTNVRDNLKTK